ncbi:hypothetical protein BHE74_00052630 [Ensete ventricosum]|nr:hypothetical protein GW17_00004865 [Ensete ventricosum]RWW41856.1 hypothetical protein BHE74_00052630 [Ensete ventricosum]RZS10598.1 hypothetical protein BHM03_00041843 [Ensete ventricosum]
MGEVKYPNSLTYPVEELSSSSVTLQRKLMEDNSYQILTIGDQYYREWIVRFISQLTNRKWE